jgi:hypothetical protein
MATLSNRLVLAVGTLVALVAVADFAIANLSLSWRPFLLLGIFVVTAAQVIILRRVTGSAFPFAAIPVVTFNIVGGAGYLYYRSIEGVAVIANALPDGSREFDTAAGIFALASLAITAGAVVGTLRTRRSPDRVAGMSSTDLASALARLPTVPVLTAVAVLLIMTILATGPAEIVDRAFYLDTAGPGWMVTFSTVLAPLGVAGAAMVLFGKRTRIGRILASILLLAYVVILLAEDTRELALVPIIVLALYVAQRPVKVRRMVPAGLVALACSFLLLQVPLALREQVPRAGLGPYVSALIQDPGLLFGGGVGGAGGVFGNVLYSVPLTGFVATDVASPPAGALLTSLSPLPGDMTAWPTIAPLLRVSPYTPFSSLGELALQGTLVSVLYFSLIGYVATRLQIRGATLHGLRSVAMQLALGGLIAAFSVSALQYNLRSTTRYVWYALGLYLVLRLTPVLARGDHRPHSPSRNPAITSIRRTAAPVRPSPNQSPRRCGPSDDRRKRTPRIQRHEVVCPHATRPRRPIRRGGRLDGLEFV